MTQNQTTQATHAGAIVVRQDRDAPRVLVVTARRTPTHWLFPKGHIDPGESAEVAALRELREEAGVTGRSLGLVGRTTFRAAAETVVTDYYLVRYESTVDSGEGRQQRWCTYEEALSLLSFADTRELLSGSAAVINRQLEAT